MKLMNWRGRIVAELEKIEPELNEAGFDDKDWPPYMKRAFSLIAKTITPSVQLKEGSSFTSKELGAMVGHKLAYVKPFAEGLHLTKGVTAKIPAELKAYFDECTALLKEYYPLVRRTVRRCLAIACEAPRVESGIFFEAFGKALQTGSLSEGAHVIGATDATEFYWMLISAGPTLTQHVKSLRDLHECCVRLWGPRAGDIKTTEMRCRRIGLRFDQGNARQQ
jgi:hypothetical protein